MHASSWNRDKSRSNGMPSVKPPIKLLVLAYDYRPNIGGVSSASFELTKALHFTPGLQIKLIAPRSSDTGADLDFDHHGHFETKRVSLPRSSLFAPIFLCWHLLFEIARWKPQAILNTLWMP